MESEEDEIKSKQASEKDRTLPNIFFQMFFHVEIEILIFVHTRDTWFINHQK